MGINPDLDISPGYIGFQEGNVKQYGYFLLFIMNLPIQYAEIIWDPNNADYHQCLPQEEQHIIIEKEEEEDANKKIILTRNQTTMVKMVLRRRRARRKSKASNPRLLQVDILWK
jgi:hypothetical protein